MTGSACTDFGTSPVPTPDGTVDAGDGATTDEDAASSPDGSGGGSDATSEPRSTACTGDDECNPGACVQGVCICNAPHWVQPDGKCGSTEPPDCEPQGGTCRQQEACEAGETEGSGPANMSCGDLRPAVCCFAECKGPADLICCLGDVPSSPVCVNGWKTCVEGNRAAKADEGCIQ